MAEARSQRGIENVPCLGEGSEGVGVEHFGP